MNFDFISEGEIRRYYGKYHDDKSRFNPPSKFYRQFLKYLKVEKGCKILDIGCGQGQILKEAENMGVFSYGVDISEEGLMSAKNNSPNSKIICCNAEKLPFKNKFFDHIIMLGTLEHFLNPADALLEATRVLIPEGKLCIVVPNLYYIKHIGNIWRKKKTPLTDQIIELVKSFTGWKRFFEENGLRVREVFKDNHILRYIGPSNSVIKKAVKAAARPFLFLLPLSLSYQFVFICRKIVNDNSKRKD